MGMSSSQARLLNLTARMHQIEYKAAKLEAQKLQMANESTKVYQDYLNALDATKIQYSTLGTDGSIYYVDATLNALENGLVSGYTGETSSTVLFLQDQDGKILITQEIADAYGLSESEDLGTLDEYLTSLGLEKTSKALYYMYEEQAVYSTREVADTSVVEGFSAVSNVEGTSSVTESVVTGYTYTPVTNTVGEITSEILDEYIGDRTITISSAEELLYLSENYADLGSYNYILTSDIDLTDYDWTSIEEFSGTFDGNGHTISGLTSALFDTLDGATVSNLGVQGEIESTTDDTGLLANSASASAIDNVYVWGSITSTGNNVGGLIGNVSKGTTVENCTAEVEVSGQNYVGGLIGALTGYSTVTNCRTSGSVSGNHCTGGVVGIDYNSEVTDCSSDCDVTGTSTNTGGLVGYGEYATISGSATGTVTGTTLVGQILGYNKKYDGIESSTVTDTGETATGAALAATVGEYDEDDYVSLSDISSKESVVTVPSLTSIASNIYYALQKAGYDDVTYDEIDSWINTYYSDDSWDNNLILANLNYYLAQYLTDGTDSSDDFISELYNAILSYDTSLIDSQYTSGYYDDTYVAVIDDSSEDTCTATAVYGTNTTTYDTVEIPSDSDIANNVYYYLRQNGYSESDITLSDVTSWIAEQDDVYLANLNYQISNGTADADGIYNAVTGGDDYDAGSRYDDSWVITQAESDSFDSSAITYGTTTETYDTGETEEVYAGSTYMTSTSADSTFYSDGWETPVSYNGYIYRYQSSDEYWNTNDSAVSTAMAVYYMAQRGVKIIEASLASSTEWLTNMINGGYAVLTTFDPSQASVLASMSEEEIAALSETEYNELLGIENTSVSTNTSLQEVTDEAALKKAEAQYEADMKKIDLKDTKYDTDLAAIETEREAIENEIDTLKTVASDNVERTFKLFS